MRDAQLLILDEPTAALDARAEFEVFQRFKELSEGKTAVLISHRFSSVRMADRILVLVDGQVEAMGTHARAAGPARAVRRAVRAAGGRVSAVGRSPTWRPLRGSGLIWGLARPSCISSPGRSTPGAYNRPPTFCSDPLY